MIDIWGSSRHPWAFRGWRSLFRPSHCRGCSSSTDAIDEQAAWITGLLVNTGAFQTRIFRKVSVSSCRKGIDNRVSLLWWLRRRHATYAIRMSSLSGTAPWTHPGFRVRTFVPGFKKRQIVDGGSLLLRMCFVAEGETDSIPTEESTPWWVLYVEKNGTDTALERIDIISRKR